MREVVELNAMLFAQVRNCAATKRWLARQQDRGLKLQPPKHVVHVNITDRESIR